MRKRAALIDSELRRGLAYVLPYRGRLAVLIALSLVSTALTLYLPYLSKELVDKAFVARDANALLRIVGYFTAASLFGFMLNVVSGLRYTKLSAQILFDMRLRLYRHLQTLSPRFYGRTPLGEIVSRLNNDIGEIQRVASETALAWLGHVVFLIGSVAIMIWLDAHLFFASIAIVPVSVLALVRYRRKLESSITVMRTRSADIGSFLIETLLGARVVTAANAQEREVARFTAKNNSFVDALMRMQSLRYLSGGMPGLLLTASTAVVFLYGGIRVIDNAISLGTFVAFIAYQMRLLGPVQGLMGLYANVASIRVSLRRVHELLDTPPDVLERNDAEPLPTVHGDVCFDNVAFSFGRGSSLLQGVALELRAGETLALVGSSGSGKSTIADLLLRHMDPDRGAVLLDGRDIRTLRLADLRTHVFVVDQEPFLFHATLAENIRYVRPHATDAELVGVLRATALDELIADLPDGLNTVVGERGNALSVGERQRIGLARALLADPAVLVLDEPTAALDPASEARVLRGYDAAMRGRTTILITHRLEVARKADRVAVLEHGRIVETGTADELLESASRFRALFLAESTPVAAISWS